MKSSIIRIALNQIFELTQIDPSSIFPDDHFHKDLGLNTEQVRGLVSSTAAQLGVDDSLLRKSELPQTPRDLVELLSTTSVTKNAG